MSLLRDKSLQKTRKPYQQNRNVRPKTENTQQLNLSDNNNFISDPDKSRENDDDYIEQAIVTDKNSSNLRTQVNLIPCIVIRQTKQKRLQPGHQVTTLHLKQNQSDSDYSDTKSETSESNYSSINDRKTLKYNLRERRISQKYNELNSENDSE